MKNTLRLQLYSFIKNKAATYSALKLHDKQIKGYSLIEFAFTFVLSVPVIFVTLDLTKIMQAKSVSKAAIDSAVRCLTVTDDPSCSEVQASAAKAVYNVRLTSSPEIIQPLVRYDSQVKFIEGPQYNVGPFNALTITEAVTEITGVQTLQAQIPIYATQADVTYFELASQRVPAIFAGNSREPEFEAGFTQVNAGSDGVSSSYSNNGNTQGVSRSAAFTVPAIFNNAICLGSGSYSKSDSSSSCADSNGKVRAIMHVKGSGSSQVFPGNKAACARARLFLEQADINSNSYKRMPLDLTGQSYWADAGNFVPRGYRKSEDSIVSNQVIPLKYDSGSETTEAFGGELLFDTNKKYRVAVEVEPTKGLNNVNCTSGDAYYKVSGVSLYFPKIVSKSLTVDCEQEQRACSKTNTCTEKGNQILKAKLPDAVFQKIITSVPRKKSQIRSETVSCGKTLASAESLDSVSKLNLDNPDCFCSDSTLSVSGLPDASIKSVTPCPQNYGVSDGIVIENKLTNSEQASQICPIVVTAADYGAFKPEQLKTYWTLNNKFLRDSVEISAYNCQETNTAQLVQNSWKQNFPDYQRPLLNESKVTRLNSKNLIASGKESTGFPEYDPQDPDNLIKTDAYNCSQFRVKKLAAHELQRTEDFIPGYLDKPQQSFTNCLGSDQSDDWKRMLSAELRRNYKNTENAFFSSDYFVTGSANFACGSFNPESECRPYSYKDVTKQVSFLLDTETDGTSLPSQCNDSCSECSLELKQIQGDLRPEIDLKQQGAKDKALKVLNTFSPWIGQDCAENNCTNFKIVTDSSQASVESIIKVPLFSKQVFSALGLSSDAKTYVEVKSQAQRPMERMIAMK